MTADAHAQHAQHADGAAAPDGRSGRDDEQRAGAADGAGTRQRPRGFRATLYAVAIAPDTLKLRVLCVLFWIGVLALAILIFGILLPKALARPMQALIRIMLTKLTKAQLGAICMAAVALLPFTLVLPALPFIWIAGMAFDFGRAYALAMGGSIIGMSLQYWVARYLLRSRIERHLQTRRKDLLTLALRMVELAGPWKAVALVRLGPSPYALLNYAFGVCPHVAFHQYIIASTLCIAHHRALSVFFGRSMPTLAELFTGKLRREDVPSAVYRIIVLLLGCALVIAIIFLARRTIRKLQEQDRLEAEAAAAAAAPPPPPAADACDVETAPHAAGPRAAGKTPLPLAVDAKLAAGGGAAAAAAAAASAQDLQVIVADDAGSSGSGSCSGNATATAAPGRALSLSHGSSGSLIGVGQAPPAAAGTDGSTTSRLSSVSSLRGLLSGRFARSA